MSKTIRKEVDDRVSADVKGLKRELTRLIAEAEDASDFEEILGNALDFLYEAQPEGQENYGAEEPIIGHVWLSRLNNEQGPGNANIEYSPSVQLCERWKYAKKTIGTIDLRGRTFSVEWDGEYDENYHQIPKVLMRDTEKVMESLGLARKQ